MRYIKISFDKIPYVRFAHKFERDGYTFSFDGYGNFLELCYHEVGPLYSVSKTGEIGYSKEDMMSISWEKAHMVTSKGKFHRHYTVSIGGQFDTQVLTRKEAIAYLKDNKNQDTDSFDVIMQSRIEESKYARQGRKIIENIIYERNQPKVNMLKVNTLIFELFDMVNSYTMSELMTKKEQHFSEEYYCQKAINYILEHMEERITVTSVAEELKLSVGYLSRLFKERTGFTLVEYINDVKINTIKDILSRGNISLKELSEITGIDDEKYICRLFKKHTGMTITEYKNYLKSEL